MKLNLNRVSFAAGLVGSVSIMAGSIITALVYTGSKGEAYSPLNHWVSELGQVSVSRAAMVFNVSLIIGGVTSAIFLVGVATQLQGRFRSAFGFMGLLAGVAGMLVGVFPMDNLATHAVAAFSFFMTILLVVSSFSIYIVVVRQSLFPCWLFIPGFVIVASIIACMMSIGSFSLNALAAPTNRLTIWNVAIFEWVAIGGLIAWVFLVALRLRLVESKSTSAAS